MNARLKVESDLAPTPVVIQDFNNMGEMQKGVKSRAFPGARPNPFQEQSVINFHRNLASYMGTGAPAQINSKPT
jgi:Ring hydroxylating alpha subunit (catalytic domain)